MVCINKLVMGLPVFSLSHPMWWNLYISWYHAKWSAQRSSFQQLLRKSMWFPTKCKLQVQKHQRNASHNCQSSWKMLWSSKSRTEWHQWSYRNKTRQMVVDYNAQYKFASTYNDDQAYKYTHHRCYNVTLWEVYNNCTYHNALLSTNILDRQFYFLQFRRWEVLTTLVLYSW